MVAFNLRLSPVGELHRYRSRGDSYPHCRIWNPNSTNTNTDNGSDASIPNHWWAVNMKDARADARRLYLSLSDDCRHAPLHLRPDGRQQ